MMSRQLIKMLLSRQIRQQTISAYIFIATLWFLITSGLLLFRLNKSQQESHEEGSFRRYTLLKFGSEMNSDLVSKISSTKSEIQLASEIQTMVPSFPAEFLMDPRFPRRYLNSTCARLPNIFDININNVYWQQMPLSTKLNIYLYAAYYDKRRIISMSLGSKEKNKGTRAIIRILAMADGLQSTLPSIWCQFWYHKRKAPAFSSHKADFEIIWKSSWGHIVNRSLVPILISCPETEPGAESGAPRVVSIVEHQCAKATNALRIQHTEEVNAFTEIKSNSIVVCVKGLTYPDQDMSVRFIEWLELLRLMGADKVFLYDIALHPRTRATLKNYHVSGFVELTLLTLPGNQPNLSPLVNLYFKKKILLKRLNEVIPYNDCLYRNIYNYKYVVLLDTDEIIVPVAPYLYTWQDLLRVAIRGSNDVPNGSAQYTSLCAQNVYFFDNTTPAQMIRPEAGDIPHYMHLLTHVIRATDYTPPGKFVKCFHSTAAVITLHNHYPIHCLPHKCRILSIDTSLGHLQHYRQECTLEVKSNCSSHYMSNTMVDTTIWKYKDRLLCAVNSILKKLGLIV